MLHQPQTEKWRDYENAIYFACTTRQRLRLTMYEEELCTEGKCSEAGFHSLLAKLLLSFGYTHALNPYEVR